MMNNLTNQQKVIVMRNGIEIWVDSSKAERFQADWGAGLKGAVQFEGRTLNTADILGVFTPQDLAELTRRKNGEWCCKSGVWHQRNTKCDCQITDERGTWVPGTGWVKKFSDEQVAAEANPEVKPRPRDFRNPMGVGEVLTRK
jgi:hypothetical protein